MYKFFIVLILSLVYLTNNAHAQCGGTPPAITNGNCLTGQSLTGGTSGAFLAGGCNGGNHPWQTFQFTAPAGCAQFDISNIAGNGTNQSWMYRFLTSGCGFVASGAGCVNGVTDGTTFSISADDQVNPGAGNYVLTPGQTYYLQIMGDNSTTFDICMSNTEAPNNECSGASGLGTGTTTFYNGGVGCAYSGTYNDPSTSDILAASEYCAGSLENTQWVQFSPLAGTNSFQIIGSNVACTGGACAYQFGIFSGTCGALTSEGCVSNGNPCVGGPDPNTSINENSTDGFSIAWSGVGATGYTATVTTSSGANYDGTEVFYLVMDGNAGSACTYDMLGINIQELPIELIYFNGKVLNNANFLTWEVASQLNNDFFTVERSINGYDWVEVETLVGAGTTTEQEKYGAVDTRFDRLVNYYRLKQTDFDGEFEYSKIISIDNRQGDIYLTGIYNLMGQEVESNYNGLKVFIYSDGSTVKKY